MLRPERARRAPRGRHRWRRRGALALAAVVGASTVAACGVPTVDDQGRAILNWYINPDGQETLTALAEECSTDDYTIQIQLLPTSATDQRTQLARRLAADDATTNLMSLDPVFVPEFANAGWLAPFEGERGEKALEGVLDGAAESVQWNDEVVAAPQWANTQVLWFRKSLAEAAGLDMSQPVTWQEIIEAADAEGGTVGVQANRYEAYVVWINALIQGAGGNILDPDTVEEGRDAKVTLDTDPVREAAKVIEQLTDSDATHDDYTTSNEGTSLGRMWPGEGPGQFMVNWTFVFKNYADAVGQPGGPPDEQALEDLGWARYPRTLPDEPSKPPVGGIVIGVGAFTPDVDQAQEAALCVTSPEAQAQLAVNDGLMPAREGVYDDPELQDAYPSDLLELYSTSIDEGGPRPKSAFYSQISSALQSVWHSPTTVSPERTPEEAQDFVTSILREESLL
ncbi:extracellular solute-binding protein [Nocardioides massiliensis]|uniref:Multiple sugar transport system substrate-binding protein n=1 Tax=Nocardioides massiliensis TaxID=1325935 RepID=A0ABT9NJK1_9ACTN|nr:extracellular solute-binding protein [Nocardioides massiliensis]MDP9820600.1 multiple sugar transport system substrate-binding protein [Nocardioides massiliensis]